MLCRWCTGTVDFGALPFAYANPTVRELLRSWKYLGDDSAREILLAKATAAWGTRVFDADALVAMPLAHRRLRARGFNQAKDIAMWLSYRTSIPVVDILNRHDRWGVQAKRRKEDRAQAMTNSPFFLTERPPAKVILVDDVFTTGATIEAARRVLLAGGAQTVEHFTLIAG
ncbi:MAG: phosphoribosyltransferase family protein [Candidatus Uhrbacteria bacterium]|nr:phosphoribosyltransferase family protein [Candidatus Uhrbacteria bacterium]